MIEAAGDATFRAGKNLILRGQKILENLGRRDCVAGDDGRGRAAALATKALGFS